MIENWAKEQLAKAAEKVLVELDRLAGGIPYLPDENGLYTDIGAKDIAWWTNGFWGGLLWQLAQETQDDRFKVAAENVEARLNEALFDFNGLHHDVGFMWLHTAVANYRLTGNIKSRTTGLHTATILAGRFNVKGDFIRAWNEDKTGWVIIDSMMNIPLLHWASQELNDPRFSEIAEKHADTIQKYMVREDGSVGHIGSFNPDTGDFIEQIGGQGYAADSSWSRGQSWAIYGFALSYHHTSKQAYLETAKKVANTFIANVALTDYIPLVDFKAPAVPVVYDTSAGLIAACGMLEIAQFVSEDEKVLYQTAAIKLIQAIADKYADWDLSRDAIIGGGTEAYHTPETYHVPLVYSDYFFVEALLRLLNKALFIW